MDIKSLIDPEGGLIDRRIFADREIYELERERLFARCWLYLGHECEIPNPGDFVTRYMGEEPVILSRDMNGRLRGMLNMCRHRGNRVCRADRGNTKLLPALIMAGRTRATASLRWCRCSMPLRGSIATSGDWSQWRRSTAIKD